MNSIIIFGCGFVGQKAYDYLNNEYNIIAYADNDSNKWGNRINGIEVVSPRQIDSCSNYTVIIAVAKEEDVIVAQLRQIGFSSIKLFQMYYDSELRESYQLLDRSKDTFFSYMRSAKDCNVTFNSNCNITTESCLSNKARQHKKVLMIAYFFPPSVGGTEQRSLKFAKYLPDYGYDVTVCTVGYMDYFLTGNLEALNEISKAKIVRIQDRPKSWRDITREEAGEIYRLYEGIFKGMNWYEEYLDSVSGSGKKLIPEDSITWVNDCLKEIDKQIDVRDYDVVYTSSSPYSAAVLGYYLKKRYNVKWVADLRDPWCENEYMNSSWFREYRKSTFKYEKEMEREVLKVADRIIVVVDRNKDDFKEFEMFDRVEVITNGYDEEEFQNIKAATFDKFTIGYFGNIYSKRLEIKPGNWSRIISEMITDGDIKQDTIQWLYYGLIEKEAADEIVKNDKYNVFKFHDRVPHKEALEIMFGTDILVAIGDFGEGANIVWSSKFIEYFRTFKPILSFSSPYGIHYDVLQEFQQGITALPDQDDKIKEFIKRVYDSWRTGEKMICGDKNKIKQFERKSLTKRLASVFDDLYVN